MEKGITYWIEYFTDKFTKITKEESDWIYNILQWGNDKRAGFLLAKQLFEEED